MSTKKENVIDTGPSPMSKAKMGLGAVMGLKKKKPFGLK